MYIIREIKVIIRMHGNANTNEEIVVEGNLNVPQSPHVVEAVSFETDVCHWLHPFQLPIVSTYIS